MEISEKNKVHLQKIDIMNLRDRIEEELREAIISGVFQPGQKIVEYDIAKQFEVSRVPVREALSALQKDGLVVNSFHKGYSVPVLTAKDIEELYDIRLILELGGLRLSLNNLDDENFNDLQNYVDQLGENLSNRNTDASSHQIVTRLDINFHEYLIKCANNDRLHKMWKSIRSQSLLLIGVTSLTNYDYVEQPKEMHQQLLNAIRSKNLDKAEKELAVHLEDAKARALRTLPEHKSSEM